MTSHLDLCYSDMIFNSYVSSFGFSHRYSFIEEIVKAVTVVDGGKICKLISFNSNLKKSPLWLLIRLTVVRRYLYKLFWFLYVLAKSNFCRLLLSTVRHFRGNEFGTQSQHCWRFTPVILLYCAGWLLVFRHRWEP